MFLPNKVFIRREWEDKNRFLIHLKTSLKMCNPLLPLMCCPRSTPASSEIKAPFDTDKNDAIKTGIQFKSCQGKTCEGQL